MNPRQARFHGYKDSNKGTRININSKKRGASDSTPGSVEERIHKVPSWDLQLVLKNLGHEYSSFCLENLF